MGAVKNDKKQVKMIILLQQNKRKKNVTLER
jgi:hypothetical protein